MGGHLAGLALSLALSASRGPGTVPSDADRPLSLTRVSRPPTVDDALSGSLADLGTPVTGFRQRTPHDGRPISAETAAYVSYDARNLYVIFVCQENPRDVRAHLTRREDIDLDDTVTVFLDTFHDRRRAYAFSTNPLGVQRDGVVAEGQDVDYSFDTLWSSEGRVTADGFVVRMAIPFKSLRFREEPGQVWGIGFSRAIVHTGEDAYWPYVTDRLEGFVQQLAPLAGPDRVAPSRNLQLIPYGSFSATRALDPGVPAFRRDQTGRAGLDAKIILNSAFTWDLTLNPDFSEVESDEPQVLVNQRFQVFFPEKRPFFLDNAGFFETPEPLFFSRHVADPEVAGRLTGKAGGWAVGVLLSDDRAAGRQAPTAASSGRRTGVGALRVQREIGRQSAIGVLATTRTIGSSFNQVVGVDLRLKIGDTWVLAGQAIRTFDRPTTGAGVDGAAYLASLLRTGRHFTYSSSYLDRSPTYHAPLGFIQRVDIREGGSHAGYSWRPDAGAVLAYGPSVTASAIWNHAHVLEDWSGVVDWSVSLKGASEIRVARTEYSELIQARPLRQHSNLASVYTSPAPWVSFSASYAQGLGANYAPAPGVAPFVGDSRDRSLGITLRPASRLRFDETYLSSTLAVATGGLVPAGVSVYKNHITRSRVHYQFTRPLSLRAILDYNRLSPNPALVAADQKQHLTGDLLVTFLLHPGTAVYLGYNNQYDNLAIDGTAPPRLVRTSAPTLSTGSQVYVKMSYLFRQ